MNTFFVFSTVLTCITVMAFADAPQDDSKELATFAGGCFWCMQTPFEQIDGVSDTIVGYTGGQTKDPTYEEISRGTTGHAEAVQVVYDPKKVSYQELLDVFWLNIDPLVLNRQFCDVGSQYRTAIFYHNEEQKEKAEASKQKLLDSTKFDHIATEITEAGPFYFAEEYHQDYHEKNPVRYQLYRYSCGRDQRLDELWKDEK
jgi:peptide-methionine (S)-S-oxide reductase